MGFSLEALSASFTDAHMNGWASDTMIRVRPGLRRASRVRDLSLATAALVAVLALVAPRSFGSAEQEAPPATSEAGVPGSAVSEKDSEWGLPKPMLEALARQAEVYRDFALRFSCTENARVAHYDESNEATRESSRKYAYLLERSPDGEAIREYREALRRRSRGEGSTAGSREVDDEEKFPPAYAWVFLFSRAHQPFFMYRLLGDRFEGFDWVHEIQFRGASPFADGKDIRQWEGTVLVDAVTLSPVEIRAEPSAQKERIRAIFDQWSQSFNLLGMRLAPRPFGYRCRVHFGYRRDRLSFPTELRYDTFRATGAKQSVPWLASVRVYEDYRFFKTSTSEVPSPAPPQ